jgi:RHS repeat-associated protein
LPSTNIGPSAGSALSTGVENLHSATNGGIDTTANLLPDPGTERADTLTVTYQTYAQDAADNLTGVDEASFAYSASVNADNQITSTTLNAQTQTYTRDANGNITEDRKHTYRWDAENRLIQVMVKSGGQVSQFLYDGLSRRVRHIEQATTTTETRYLWCGEQLCQQRDSADAVTARYYAQGEQHLGAITQSLYYAQDHLGSVIATTDSAGNTLGSAEYTAYGRTLTQSGTQADFGYAQMYRHGATGLYLTHYRPYDPDTGRWLARDPIGEEGGLNLYGSVGNNPIGRIDPSGLADVRIWNYRGSGPNDAWGHASMSINSGSTHISWWPGGQRDYVSETLNLYSAPANPGQSLNDDIYLEEQGPDEIIHLDNLDEDAIAEWWAEYQRNREWFALGRNCAATVAAALAAGGGDYHVPFYPKPVVWTPASVRAYAEAIQRAGKGVVFEPWTR